MKKLLLLTIAIWYLTAGCYSQTDWKSFMSRQDMTWTRLPQTWYEAPFMGNGSMGSYICKEPGKNAIRVDVGNSMVHDHRTDDASIYGRGRLLIGYFLLHPVGEIKSGDLRLDLWNAETTGCIRTTRGEIKLRACVTSESPYILVEAEATAGEKEFTWKFYPENTDSPRQLNAIRKGNKNHLQKDYVSNPARRRRYCHSLERDKEREYKHAYRKQRTFLSQNRGFAKGGNGTGKPAGSRPARAPESTPGMVA